jgi:hypothetical protein
MAILAALQSKVSSIQAQLSKTNILKLCSRNVYEELGKSRKFNLTESANREYANQIHSGRIILYTLAVIAEDQMG